MLNAFARLNKRLCLSVHHRLPWRFRRDFFQFYYELVCELFERQPLETVVDAGCGRETHYSRLLPCPPGALVGFDVDRAEITRNVDLSARLVADASQALPFADASVDLVTSRSVVEHLPDSGRFFDEVQRVLRPGGYTIHVLPGRNAPFSLLNRALPNRVTQRLLRFFYPEISGGWGFPAFYDNCSYPLLRRALERSGLQVEQLHCRYYQATYYRAFLPAYLLFVAYDMLLWAVGARRLASQLIVVARRPPG